MKLQAIIIAAALAFPSAAFAAETNKLIFHDVPKQLTGSNNQAAFVAEGTLSTVSRTIVGKALLQNTSGVTVTAQCKLDDGASADYGVATLSPGAWQTVTMEIASEAGTNRGARMDCWITSGQTSGVNAQWGKLLIRYSPATLSIVAW